MSSKPLSSCIDVSRAALHVLFGRFPPPPEIGVDCCCCRLCSLVLPDSDRAAGMIRLFCPILIDHSDRGAGMMSRRRQ